MNKTKALGIFLLVVPALVVLVLLTGGSTIHAASFGIGQNPTPRDLLIAHPAEMRGIPEAPINEKGAVVCPGLPMKWVQYQVIIDSRVRSMWVFQCDNMSIFEFVDPD